MHHRHAAIQGLIFGFVLLLGLPGEANIKLPAFFADHMVLQRDCPVPVWGWAGRGEQIVVRFGDQEKTTTADGAGKWKVVLDALETSVEPRELEVRGRYTLVVRDVLVGEVWLCSGQSNMQWTVSASANPEEEIAAGDHPLIRMFNVERRPATGPQDDLFGSWQVCSPASVAQFSAVAYYFGRSLREEMPEVPIGLLNSSWGGTRAEAWTGAEALGQMGSIKKCLWDWHVRSSAFDAGEAEVAFQKAHADWRIKVDEVKRSNQALGEGQEAEALPREPVRAEDPRQSQHHPSNLYDGMIAPFRDYALRGAIWYQGESNRERAVQYRGLMGGLVGDWRRQWGAEFPFYQVQLANFMAPSTEPGTPDSWAELQWSQLLVSRDLTGVGVAVINDIGEQGDIHPKNKQEVGRRLALWALAKDYGQGDIVYSGPLYSGHEIEGEQIRIRFEHVGSGLRARDGQELKRFEIAGDDRVWKWAKAEIDGDTIVVKSDEVGSPVAVRYAWAANPEGANLINEEGLPASLFRTDDWPLSTDGAESPF
jgi:sialate O-acetylesterase